MKGATAPRRSIPADPSRAYKQIARSWEAFVGSRKLAGALPRPVIAQSWERSRELGKIYGHLPDDDVWKLIAYIRSIYQGDPSRINW